MPEKNKKTNGFLLLLAFLLCLGIAFMVTDAPGDRPAPKPVKKEKAAEAAKTQEETPAAAAEGEKPAKRLPRKKKRILRPPPRPMPHRKKHRLLFPRNPKSRRSFRFTTCTALHGPRRIRATGPTPTPAGSS